MLWCLTPSCSCRSWRSCKMWGGIKPVCSAHTTEARFDWEMGNLEASSTPQTQICCGLLTVPEQVWLCGMSHYPVCKMPHPSKNTVSLQKCFGDVKENIIYQNRLTFHIAPRCSCVHCWSSHWVRRVSIPALTAVDWEDSYLDYSAMCILTSLPISATC